MPWPKIMLGAVSAAVIVSCSLIDAVGNTSEPPACTGDMQICSFCEQRAALGACGNNDPTVCREAWNCVKGPIPGCGAEFAQMLDHFLTTPSECFNEGITAVQTFRSCKPDAGGAACF